MCLLSILNFWSHLVMPHTASTVHAARGVCALQSSSINWATVFPMPLVNSCSRVTPRLACCMASMSKADHYAIASQLTYTCSYLQKRSLWQFELRPFRFISGHGGVAKILRAHAPAPPYLKSWLLWISKFLPFYVVAIRFAHAHYSNLNCTHCSLNGSVMRLYTRKDWDEHSASINTAPLPIWDSSLEGLTWLTSLAPRVRNGHDYTYATPFAYTQYGKNLENHSTPLNCHSASYANSLNFNAY
jgi:hypothetical protein